MCFCWVVVLFCFVYGYGLSAIIGVGGPAYIRIGVGNISIIIRALSVLWYNIAFLTNACLCYLLVMTWCGIVTATRPFDTWEGRRWGLQAGEAGAIRSFFISCFASRVHLDKYVCRWKVLRGRTECSPRICEALGASVSKQSEFSGDVHGVDVFSITPPPPSSPFPLPTSRVFCGGESIVS